MGRSWLSKSSGIGAKRQAFIVDQAVHSPVWKSIVKSVGFPTEPGHGFTDHFGGGVLNQVRTRILDQASGHSKRSPVVPRSSVTPSD